MPERIAGKHAQKNDRYNHTHRFNSRVVFKRVGFTVLTIQLDVGKIVNQITIGGGQDAKNDKRQCVENKPSRVAPLRQSNVKNDEQIFEYGIVVEHRPISPAQIFA